MLALASCNSPTEPMPFDWPAQAADKLDWGLAKLAPATATLTTRLNVEPGKQRDDRWQFELATPRQGRITHDMTWRGPKLALRRERQEALLDGDTVQTRALGPQFVQWPDDSRWREFMARPATDWEGLLSRLGDRVEVKELERDASGAVVAARLVGGGAGWRAELGWSVKVADAP